MNGYTYPCKLGRELSRGTTRLPFQKGTTPYRGRITASCRTELHIFPRGYLTLSAPRRNAAVPSPYRFQPPLRGRYLSVRLAIDGGEPHRRFSIFIGDEAARGRGIGTEAAKLMIQYGFEELGLHRIYLRALAGNMQAIRSYEKAGFEHEGY